MAPLAPNLQERVRRLLLALPQWEDPGARAALMGGILRHGYPRWHEINDFTGSSQEAADRFLGQADPLALRLLLAGLHQQFENDLRRRHDIEAVEAAVRDLLPRRPRVAWNKEPYPGLNYFDFDDAPIFFGRDAEVAALVEKVTTTTEQGRRFTIVLGASGAGKSSLVRAGLWAQLASSKPDWLITAMKPWEVDWGPEQCLRAALPPRLRAVAASANQGSLAQLAEKLLPAGDARWLLILDQMEELFAPGRQEKGQAFLERVVEAAYARQSRFQVVATLRADFYHHLLAYPGLQQVLNAGGTFSLAAPGRLALEEMVRGPIEDVDLADPFTVDARLPALLGRGRAGGAPGGRLCRRPPPGGRPRCPRHPRRPYHRGRPRSAARQMAPAQTVDRQAARGVFAARARHHGGQRLAVEKPATL